MLTVTVKGDTVLLAGLGRIAPEVRKNLAATMERLVARLQRDIWRTRLAGKPLHATRGKLHQSIQTSVEVRDAGREVRGTVYVAGEPRRWAGVHELGGVVNVPGFTRKSGSYVHPFSYKARRRAFLHPVLRVDRRDVLAALREAVGAAVERSRHA